jgi:S1-C subfamily serine protease
MKNNREQATDGMTKSLTKQYFNSASLFFNKTDLLVRIMCAAAFFTATAFAITGCTSIRQPSAVYSQPDYTAKDVHDAEIKRIGSIQKDDDVQALWRACLLGDEETKSSCFETTVSSYKAALEKKDWFNSLRLYRSLKAAGYAELSSLEKDESELLSLMNADVPGLTKNKSSASPAAENVTKSGALAAQTSTAVPKARVSSYINGTVTVWVDLGMKIEKGMGYADRVIGSGFFISKDGYIVTNHHVIADLVNPKYEGYSRLYIKLASDSDTRIPAKVIGWDPVVDLALLKAEVEAPYVFTLGSSEDLDVGDRIYAIGSPVGLERTLTSGIVSATDRKLFSIGAVMQIDAAVNSGNSGGPCIDENGAVQAIVFAGMLQYEGLNFAIPVEYLKADLSALYHGGKYEHPWLCAYGHTKKDLGKDAGLEIQYVMPGGSASRAKLKEGDVITAIDGESVKSLEDVQKILLYRSSKTIVSISYSSSDGEAKTCIAYLSARPENPGYTVYNNDVLAGSFIPLFGMKLTSVSTASNRKYSISSIIKGSVADESGFSENDPVEIQNVKFNDDNSAVYAELYAKKRKKGYLDASMAIASPLDSPYYF